jgi:hypothetical protein
MTRIGKDHVGRDFVEVGRKCIGEVKDIVERVGVGMLSDH